MAEEARAASAERLHWQDEGRWAHAELARSQGAEHRLLAEVRHARDIWSLYLPIFAAKESRVQKRAFWLRDSSP